MVVETEIIPALQKCIARLSTHLYSGQERSSFICWIITRYSQADALNVEPSLIGITGLWFIGIVLSVGGWMIRCEVSAFSKPLGLTLVSLKNQNSCHSRKA